MGKKRDDSALAREIMRATASVFLDRDDIWMLCKHRMHDFDSFDFDKIFDNMIESGYFFCHARDGELEVEPSYLSKRDYPGDRDDQTENPSELFRALKILLEEKIGSKEVEERLKESLKKQKKYGREIEGKILSYSVSDGTGGRESIAKEGKKASKDDETLPLPFPPSPGQEK